MCCLAPLPRCPAFPLALLLTPRHPRASPRREEEEAFNSARADALGQGTTWERVCDLVDLKDSRSKTSTQSKQDLTRFKEILLALKREGESAPGAGGY